MMMRMWSIGRWTGAPLRFLLLVGLLIPSLCTCGDGDGGCPGVIIPACTSQYLPQCPKCSAGDNGWCVGYGFEPNRCCGCGSPP